MENIKNNKISLLVIYARIIAGVIILASSIIVFYEPNGLVTGGVSGICIIVATYVRNLLGVDIPLSVLSILFNLPLLITGYIVLGKNFIWRTIFAAVFFSVALGFTSYLPVYKGDLVLASVFGGVVMGVGVGLTMLSFSSTGGSDLFGVIVHKLNRNISVANSMFAFDAIVIAAGFLLFGFECGMYAIISVFISSKVVDVMLEGVNFSLCAFIASTKSDEIAQEILHTMSRGVTGLKGTGMYTKAEMNVLFCTVGKKEILTLKRIVSNLDPNAFMIITNVKEALGEGFGKY